MQYELFYLVGASRESELEKIKGGVEEIVVAAGGQFLEKTTLEKRRLSYTVKHENHGIYIARRFELADSEKLQEITKKLNLSGDILRFILSRAEELPELKSKEERMTNQVRTETPLRDKREVPAPKREIPKKTLSEVKPEETKETPQPQEEEPKNDDLDKKLEEILNI